MKQPTIAILAWRSDIQLTLGGLTVIGFAYGVALGMACVAALVSAGVVGLLPAQADG